MRVLQGLLLSLAVHVILVIIIQNIPVPPKSTTEIVEFDYQSQNETNKVLASSVVKDIFVPDKYRARETEDKLRFLSDKVQRVKEQTRAALNGKAENRSNSGSGSKKNLEAFAPSARRFIPRPGSDGLDSGVSSIEQELDGVKIGSITALNTEQYLFYSFYSRATELIYFRWTTLAREARDRVIGRAASLGSNEKWTTEVDIWLKPNGEYHSAHVMRSSSIPEFDRAAVTAFRQAGLFPNPPKELVEEDGFIHLKYGFVVIFDPKVVVWK